MLYTQHGLAVLYVAYVHFVLLYVYRGVLYYVQPALYSIVHVVRIVRFGRIVRIYVRDKHGLYKTCWTCPLSSTHTCRPVETRKKKGLEAVQVTAVFLLLLFKLFISILYKYVTVYMLGIVDGAQKN